MEDEETLVARVLKGKAEAASGSERAHFLAMAEKIKPAPVLDGPTRMLSAKAKTMKAEKAHTTALELVIEIGRKLLKAEKDVHACAVAVHEAKAVEAAAVAEVCPPAAAVPQATGPRTIAIEDILEGGTNLFQFTLVLADELGEDLAAPDRKIIVDELGKLEAVVTDMLKVHFEPAVVLMRAKLHESAPVLERLQKRRRRPDSEEESLGAASSGGGAPVPVAAVPGAGPPKGSSRKAAEAGGAAAAAAVDEEFGDGEGAPQVTLEELRAQSLAAAAKGLGRPRT